MYDAAVNSQYRKTLLLAGFAFGIGLFAFMPVLEANCAPPMISLNIGRGERGTTLTVTGIYFATACDDVGGSGGRIQPRIPAKKIKIFLKQGKKSTLLTTVAAADSNLRFSVDVTIPASAMPGKATLTADAYTTTRPVDFEILENAQH